MAQVRLFGRLADISGWRERTIATPATLAALKAVLAAEDAALGEALGGPGIQAAVDRVLVRGDVDLAKAREIAFMPPMSGG